MVKTFDFFYRFYSFKLLGTTVGYMSKKQPSDNPTKAASRSEKENFENKGDRRMAIFESVTGKMAKTGEHSVQKCGGMVF